MTTYEDIPFTKNPGSPPDRFKVKTCTNPDQVCLQGGCGYCRYGTFKMVKTLRAYAARLDDLEPNPNGKTGGWLKSFNYGWGYGWPNYPMKRPKEG